jgi:hypothetical protein
VFFHWWVAIISFGLWLIPAILLTLIGGKVTRKIPVRRCTTSFRPTRRSSRLGTDRHIGARDARWPSAAHSLVTRSIEPALTVVTA